MKIDILFPEWVVGSALVVLLGTFLAGYHLGTIPKKHVEPEPEAKPKQLATNIVDNGLGAWLADTNHHFGPWAAKSIYVMQLQDGKFHIRFRDVNRTNTEFQGLFETDTAYDTADEARQTFSLNMDLRIRKTVSDSLENAFK